MESKREGRTEKGKKSFYLGQIKVDKRVSPNP
jgi:hypothetical protein